MWRGSLDKDEERISNFLEATEQISNYVSHVKKIKNIKYFYFFPYTVQFAKICIDMNYIDGIITYRNPLECKFDKIIRNCLNKSKKCITIRPFAAGDALSSGYKSKDLIEYAFNIKSINGTILSISSIDQINFG